MTSRERVHTVLDGRKADRVPIALILDGSYLYRATGVDPREHQYGGNAVAADIQRRFRLRHPLNDMVIAWSGVSRELGTTRKLVREGDRFFLTNVISGEKEELAAPPSGHTSLSGPTSELSLPDPVVREADIPRALGPVPTVDEVIQSGRLDILAGLHESIGANTFLCYRPGELAPPAITCLGGFERAFETMMVKPALAHAVVEHLARQRIAEIRASSRFAPDAVLLTAFLEGPDLISPDTWRQVVMPGHKLMVDEARRQGQKVIMWWMGACIPLLNDIVGLGIDALIVEQSRCAYSSDPAEIRRVVGDRVCIFGWTPELGMINDNRTEITQVVEQQMMTAGKTGPFAMSTTFLTGEVAPETVDFFCQEVVRVSASL